MRCYINLFSIPTPTEDYKGNTWDEYLKVTTFGLRAVDPTISTARDSSVLNTCTMQKYTQNHT